MSDDHPPFKRLGAVSTRGDDFASNSVLYRCDICAATVAEDDDGLRLHASWHERVDFFKAAFGWAGGRV